MRLTESEKKLIQSRRRNKRTRKSAPRKTAVRRKRQSILPDYITIANLYNRLAIVGGAGVLLSLVLSAPLHILLFLSVWLVSVLRFSHSCKMQRVLNL
jgi:hypothetical protein